MAAKHMKLLLAALALLFALTVTFTYAEEGGEGEGEGGASHSNDGSNHSGSDELGIDSHSANETGSDSNSSDESGANGDCKVEHCERCHTNRDDICKRCEPSYRINPNNLQCREGALAPVGVAAAVLAACATGAAMMVL